LLLVQKVNYVMLISNTKYFIADFLTSSNYDYILFIGKISDVISIILAAKHKKSFT